MQKSKHDTNKKQLHCDPTVVTTIYPEIFHSEIVTFSINWMEDLRMCTEGLGQTHGPVHAQHSLDSEQYPSLAF